MIEQSSPIMSTISSPTSSPARTTTTMDLTPRSKIRALLAAVDHDSDKENDVQADHTTTERPATTITKRTLPFSQSDDESEEDVIRQPARKNTMLSRLLHADNDVGMASEEDAADDGNAYARIRQQLLTSRTGDAGEAEPAQASASSDSDSAPTAKKRKRVLPKSTASTPPRKMSEAPQSSPGLFVSPDKPRSPSPTVEDASDSDSLPTMNRLQELVAKKRAEREAREQAAEDARRAASSSPAPGGSTGKKKSRKAVQVESETDEDKDIADKLTSSARPTRKASKRAMAEMQKETQRMSRNMQLTHEAKTKIKFSTNDFLKKFNFRQNDVSVQQATEPSASSSVPSTSDTEKQQAGTPPSSPPTIRAPSPKIGAMQSMLSSPLPPIPAANDEDNDDELPDLHSALSEVAERAVQAQQQQKALSSPAPQRMSVKKFGKSAIRPKPADDDDDDLEIVQDVKPSRFDVFDLIQPSRSRPAGAMNVVKALAHANDSHRVARGKPKGKPSMTAGELQVALQRRAREQAQREREEKIERLREKGIYVQTAEEKEREQLQIEDMLEKARREADGLAKKERELAKKQGKEADGDALPDSDDDEDWDGEEEEEEPDVDMSGSEEEKEEGDDDEGDDEEEDDADAAEDDEVENQTSNALIDQEADDADAEEEADDDAEDADNDNVDAMLPTSTRRPRKKIVDSDDEEDTPSAVPAANTTATPARLPAAVATPKSALADAFGFAQPQDGPLGGLSQMFAGTMAESQVPATGDTEAIDSQEDSLAFLRGLPPPTLPDFGAFADDSQDILVANSQADQSQSQVALSQPGLFRFDTQTQVPYVESQSQAPMPTQDVGFQHYPTPVKPQAPQESFVTVDTVALSGRQPQTEVVSDDEEGVVQKRRGRLVRRDPRETEEADEPDDVVMGDADINEQDDHAQNAFLIMRQAAAKPAVPAFDKKRSEAKGMVEEQAEESEDEYAGLGGVSDEEDGELDEETRKMIDDDSNEKLNERAMAKFHADKERAEDEKRVSRLFKDIANGGLRKKRGAEMELWDSDDEDEAAARRRAIKQREFAKMRKALLADEKLGKIAENPKQQAFLAAIEDRDDDTDLDMFDMEEPSQPTYSQLNEDSQNQDTGSSSKRDLSTYAASTSVADGSARPPPHLRRTNRPAKPTSLVDIRNTLSELIGEDSMIEPEIDDEPFAEEDLIREGARFDHEEEDDDLDLNDSTLATDRSELMPPPAATITSGSRTGATAIDRIAARRAAHNARASGSTTNKTAFETGASSTIPSFFRKPSLLRRATTASSSTSDTNPSNSTSRGGLGLADSVKQGGTKKSSVNYYVREKEKMAKVERVERERKEGRERVGKMRREGLMGAGRSGLGGLVGGHFE